MRISADALSADYWANHFRKPVLVALDGVQVRGCTIADSDDGWVQCARYDSDGRLVVVVGDEVVEDRKSGRVLIIGERR